MFDDSEDITKNRHGGNANSVEAHNKLLAVKGQRRQEVLGWIKTFGKYGGTLEQICQRSNLDITQVSGRVSELKKEGLVQVALLKGKTKHGNTCDILVAV